ncbi:MAG: metallophosphoesterase family protein [Myxococcota bacterium]
MLPRRPPRLTTARVRVPLRADGGLRLGLVADTHSKPHEGGLAHLASKEPDVLLHGGDIGDLSVLDRLAAIAPVHAVRGNIDVRAKELPDVLEVTLTEAERPAFTLLLTHIAVAGPRIRADAAKRARAAGAKLIICGHSHVPFFTEERGLTLFNPGSLGPRRFQLPILFGVMEVTRAGVSLAHVDAETGKPWLP